MKKIGINGFGRIGRYFTRLALEQEDMEVVMVNDISDIHTLAHLLKYDSVHRSLKHTFHIEGQDLVFTNGKKIRFMQANHPSEIPWSELGVTHVLEATGKFKNKSNASAHLQQCVEKVIITAPAEDESIKSIVLGVNDHLLEPSDVLISNASCTTNSAAPMVQLIKEICNIESAYITTVHSYTTDQKLHDAPHKDLRRARAGAQSIVPTTTGAAKALTKIFPDLGDVIGGCGIRVPVPNGSLTDLTIHVSGEVPSVDNINNHFRSAAKDRLAGILQYETDPIVSADIIGNSHSCIFDSLLTSTVGNMIKLVGWYDNEAGYSNRLVDLVRKV